MFCKSKKIRSCQYWRVPKQTFVINGKQCSHITVPCDNLGGKPRLGELARRVPTRKNEINRVGKEVGNPSMGQVVQSERGDTNLRHCARPLSILCKERTDRARCDRTRENEFLEQFLEDLWLRSVSATDKNLVTSRDTDLQEREATLQIRGAIEQPIHIVDVRKDRSSSLRFPKD